MTAPLSTRLGSLGRTSQALAAVSAALDCRAFDRRLGLAVQQLQASRAALHAELGRFSPSEEQFSYYPGVYVHEAVTFRDLRACARCGRVISDAPTALPAGPVTIYPVAAPYPDVLFVGAHPGVSLCGEPVDTTRPEA